VTETDKAILSLKTQRRKLNEYQRQLQEKIVSAVEKAQACVAKKDKRTALHNLKQKRIFEVRLGEIEKYLMNVEEMVSADTYSVLTLPLSYVLILLFFFPASCATLIKRGRTTKCSKR